MTDLERQEEAAPVALLEMRQTAEDMALSTLLPDHLRVQDAKGNLDLRRTQANYMLIAHQAQAWKMSPYMLAPVTYVVKGKLAYEGKLVAAIVNRLAGLKYPLSYKYTGEKGTNNYTVTVYGTFAVETKARTITFSVGEGRKLGGKAGGHPMWTTNPDQKLIYNGATVWARTHCPEVILGILLVDEAAAEEPVRVEVEVGRPKTTEARLEAFAKPDVVEAEVVEERVTESAKEGAFFVKKEAKPDAVPLINLRRVQELAKLGTKASVSLKALGKLSLSLFGEGKGTLGSLTAKEADELASALLDMMEAAKKEEGDGVES